MKNNRQKFAFISVTDKTNLDTLARKLIDLGYQIVASLKTAEYIKNLGLPVIDVERVTGYPAIVGLQGIKIIHPKIFAGVLANPKDKTHLDDLKKYDINFYEIVVCNFYPFKESISKNEINHKEAIFNLDIGGPAIVRCAAKNYENVSILTETADYGWFLKKLEKNGQISLSLKQKLSLKAFKYTRDYDEMIINYLTKKFNAKNTDSRV